MTSTEPCTTWAQRKRHYSTDLAASTYGTGSYGQTLCRENGEDEVRVNARNAESGEPAIVIADLDECKKCARVLAKERASR